MNEPLPRPFSTKGAECRCGTRRLLTCALLLYIIAAAVRLTGIVSPALHPDEVNWRRRSFEVMRSLRAGHLAMVTKRLGHPGIPPALAMASGEAAGRKFNKYLQLEPGDRYYIDLTSSARIANALLSAGIAPLFFLGLAGVFGLRAAIFGGLLMTADIQHVGNSRLAHIDASLTVFTWSAVALYTSAVLRNSLKLKLLAGLCWGLGAATKPTVVALIPAFAAFKAIRNWMVPPAGDRAERALISWSDVWAVLLGQTLFAAVFTRLWWHDSEYLWLFKIHSGLADFFYQTGCLFKPMQLPLLMLVGLTALVLLTSFFRKAAAKPGRCDVAVRNLLGLLAVLILALLFVPQVLENIARYWVRAFGLASWTHKSLGIEWPRPPWGYLGIMLSRVPALALVSFTAGLICTVLFWKRLWRTEPGRKQASLLTMALLVTVIWPLILNISAKQTFRYVLPVMPCVYVIGVFGVLTLCTQVWRRRQAPGLSRHAAAAAWLGAAALMFYPLAALHPDHLLYSNRFFGRLAAQHGLLSPAGMNAALHFLHQQAEQSGTVKSVAITGEVDAINESYRRLYPVRPQVKLWVMPEPLGADYLLVIPNLLPAFAHEYGLEIGRSFKEVFNYQSAGQPVITVYEVNPPDYRTPLTRELARSYHRTGHNIELKEVIGSRALVKEEKFNKVRAAVPGRHSENFLFFGEFLPISAGEYEIRYQVALPKNYSGGRMPEEKVLRLEFGNNCERLLLLRDLLPGTLTWQEMQCGFSETVKAQIRGYWFGTVPVVVKAVSVRRRTQD